MKRSRMLVIVSMSYLYYCKKKKAYLSKVPIKYLSIAASCVPWRAFFFVSPFFLLFLLLPFFFLFSLILLIMIPPFFCAQLILFLLRWMIVFARYIKLKGLHFISECREVSYIAYMVTKNNSSIPSYCAFKILGAWQGGGVTLLLQTRLGVSCFAVKSWRKILQLKNSVICDRSISFISG